MTRSDEEVVEREDAQDGGDERGKLTAPDGKREHGQQVDDPQSGGGRGRLQRGDGTRGDSDRRDDLQTDHRDQARIYRATIYVCMSAN